MTMVVADVQLDQVLELYLSGRMLRAYEAAQALGPLHTWRGATARVLAGRLAMNLGAPRLGHVLHRLAYRDDSGHPEAIYYNARAVFGTRGPLAAWELLQRTG